MAARKRKASTKVSANPRPRKRKARAAAPKRRKARALRAKNPAPHRAKRVKRRNPAHKVAARKRRRNPDGAQPDLVTLAISAGGGAAAAIFVSSVAKGLLRNQIKSESNRTLAAHAIGAAGGAAALYFGHKKRIKWLKQAGAGAFVSSIAFAVYNFSGKAIEDAAAKLLPKGEGQAPGGGYRRLSGLHGYHRLDQSGVQGYSRIVDQPAMSSY